MKLRETIRYELAYQLRRPATWLYVAALFSLLLLMTSQAQIADAQSGDAPVNTPYVLAMITLFGSVFALLPFAAVAGEAAGRDVQTGMSPLAYTAPVGKATYLGGRLLAALALAALVSLAAPLGTLAAVVTADAPPDVLGPVRPSYYLAAWLLVGLSNVVVAATFGFAAATAARRPMASFGAVAALFLLALLCYSVLARRFDHWTVAGLLDPLGFTPFAEMSRGWTPAQKLREAPYLQAGYLANRALWLAAAAGAMLVAHRRFRFTHHVDAAARTRQSARRAREAPAATLASVPAARGAAPTPSAARRRGRAFGPATRARQLAAVAAESLRVVVRSPGGLVMLALAVLVVVFGPEMMEFMGVPMLPTTAHIATYLMTPGELPTALPPLLIAYYAGELVWRDREAGLGEIAGAAPVPDWVYLLGRVGGLGVALAAMQALMMAAAMLVQLRMGYLALEPGLHLRLMVGIPLADLLLWVALATAVHVVVAHKYVGHGAMLLAYGLVLAGPSIGLEHPLLVFTKDPGHAYSDMHGFGGSVGPWLVLQLYWTAWVSLLLLAGALLWVRGREDDAATRLRIARRRLTPRAAGAAAGAAALVLATGGFAFYNTNVRNEYRTARERTAVGAEYERRYGRYEGIAQPRLAAVRLHAELYPARRAAELRASYHLVHDGPAPVESLHVTTHPSVVTGPLTLDRPAALAVSDDRHGYRVLALRDPLAPGDTLRLDFTVRVGRPGFASDGVDDLVTANGTYLRSGVLPRIGYQPDRELSDLGDRREHGLPPRPRVPSLDDTTARHAVARAGAEQIAFEATIGTDAGQRAVAPGALRRTWTERGRRYFHYATERPIRNDFALFSAAYAVKAGRWRDPSPRSGQAVEIEVLHHPEHGWNVDGMLAGVRASLEHLSAELGPYPHRQLRLVEHPGRGGTLHAYPINVSFEEGFALMEPSRDEGGLDFPFAVVAHELAHQWWGGRLTPARAEGRALLSESLAWYSAMGVVEHARGPEELERLVALMREAWRPPRAPSDPPLLQASDWFLAYRKGPLALYALREYVGADRVNDALRALLAAHPAGTPPLPTTRDLYRELEAVTPDSLRPLLEDLFAANTLWELATDSVSAEPAPGGTARMTLLVRARKIVVDTAGTAREVPMDDLVEVGAFAAGADGARGQPVYRRLHRIRSGTQRVTLAVPASAAWAGVDPRSLLFDLEPENNVARLPRRE